jgi:murein DD-endopeptidase MepM/ murein hydrolase activator NlpD
MVRSFKESWICIPQLVVATILIAFVLSGCASTPAAKNERAGLFDVWGKMKSPKLSRREARDPDSDEGESDDTATIPDVALSWPLKAVQITSRFGKRGGDFHEGVDLRARQGTPVFAAQSGTVLYAGSKLRGYGWMVVIGHRKGVATVYAHNSKIFVKKGQKVIQGMKIALSGKTGRARGPHLHFEVRSGTKAIDPLKVLPQIATAGAPPVRVAEVAKK